MSARQKRLLALLGACMALTWGGLAALFLWSQLSPAWLPSLPSIVTPTPGPPTVPPPPTWPPTWTPTTIPTATLTPTAGPSPTAYPTRTPFPTPKPPTPTIFIPPPTNTPPYAECVCFGDLYDCEDFTTQAAAQACYDQCAAPGYGDIHHLDWNKDGIVCEQLP